MYSCVYVYMCILHLGILYETTAELDKLEVEFLDYPLMEESETPNIVWEAALTKVDEEQKLYRMDVIWNYLSSMTRPDGVIRFYI